MPNDPFLRRFLLFVITVISSFVISSVYDHNIFLIVTIFWAIVISIGIKRYGMWLFDNDDNEKEHIQDLDLAKNAGLVGHSLKVAPVLGFSKGEFLNYAGERHLVTFAPNGSGKFSTVQSYVLASLERSIFCIDPKGQAAAVTARRRQEMGHKVITLNPFGLHSGPPWNLPSHRFNPLATLDKNSPSFVADVARLVDGLIDLSGKESSHWANSARDLFSWLIMWTVFYEGEKTLSTVRDLLCLPEQHFCSLAEKAASDDYPPLRNKAAAFVGNKAELTNELRSVISTAKTETRIFDDPVIRESLGESDFDFSELKKGKTSVYVVLPADFLGSHAKWLRVVVMSALSSMYKNPEGERVLFLLDEFAQLGYLPDMEKAAGLVRGYGVQLWPFFQDYNQLASLYGDRAETFLANAGIQQVFTAAEMTTAEYFSKRSGVVNTWRKTKGDNSNSKTETQESFFTPHDIIGLSAYKQLIFKDGIDKAILAGKLSDYFSNPELASIFDPDPYHKPQGDEERQEASGAGDVAEAPA